MLDFIIVVLGVAFGMVLGTVGLTCVMFNAKVMKWFMNKYMKMLDDVMTDEIQ